ncbi:hypothetical protein HZS_7136 [Henneguya salminicola]|nr:hypothetical protein HZS_7136 [Henneguya salminicola]
MIGWGIILFTLILFSTLSIIYNIRASVKPLDVLMLNFLELRRTEIQNLLYEELSRLAKEMAKKKVKKVLTASTEEKDVSMHVVHSFMHNAIKLEKSKDVLEAEQPNIMVA